MAEQVQIAISVDKDFKEELDEYCKYMQTNKTQLIRSYIVDKVFEWQQLKRPQVTKVYDAEPEYKRRGDNE